MAAEKTQENIEKHNKAVNDFNKLIDKRNRLRKYNEMIYEKYLENKENSLSIIERLPIKPEGCP